MGRGTAYTWNWLLLFASFSTQLESFNLKSLGFPKPSLLLLELHPKQTAALLWQQWCQQKMPNVFKTVVPAFEVNSTWWCAIHIFYFNKWTKNNLTFYIYIKIWGSVLSDSCLHVATVYYLMTSLLMKNQNESS